MRSFPIALGFALVIATAGLSATQAGQPASQHEHGGSPGRLGTVHFDTSCAPAVLKEFDRGVALLHSFWFTAAIQSFDSVLKEDPQCVMARWGLAMEFSQT